MQIIQLGFQDRVQLEEICTEYDELVLSDAIKPEVFHGIILELFSMDHRLMVARHDNGTLGGMLMYIQSMSKDWEGLSKRIQYSATLPDDITDETGTRVENIDASIVAGFRVYTFNGDLAFLDSMECFPKKQGIGRKLISALQERDGIEGVFLEAVNGSDQFYGKLGFEKSLKNLVYMLQILIQLWFLINQDFIKQILV